MKFYLKQTNRGLIPCNYKGVECSPELYFSRMQKSAFKIIIFNESLTPWNLKDYQNYQSYRFGANIDFDHSSSLAIGIPEGEFITIAETEYLGNSVSCLNVPFSTATAVLENSIEGVSGSCS